MSTSKAKRIERAAVHLGAVRVSRGWAYYAHETSSYWIVSSAALAELRGYLDIPARDGGGYSGWCAGCPGREMPRGWEPV